LTEIFRFRGTPSPGFCNVIGVVADLMFSLSLPLDIWGVGDTIFVESCGEGESVTGFNYDFVTWDYNDGDTYGGDAIFGEYVITSIGLECSTSGEKNL